MVAVAGLALTLIGFAGLVLAVLRGAKEHEQARHLGRCRKAMEWKTDMEGEA